MKVALPLTFFRADKQLLSLHVGSVNSNLVFERCFLVAIIFYENLLRHVVSTSDVPLQIGRIVYFRVPYF